MNVNDVDEHDDVSNCDMVLPCDSIEDSGSKISVTKSKEIDRRRRDSPARAQEQDNETTAVQFVAYFPSPAKVKTSGADATVMDVDTAERETPIDVDGLSSCDTQGATASEEKDDELRAMVTSTKCVSKGAENNNEMELVREHVRIEPKNDGNKSKMTGKIYDTVPSSLESMAKSNDDFSKGGSGGDCHGDINSDMEDDFSFKTKKVKDSVGPESVTSSPKEAEEENCKNIMIKTEMMKTEELMMEKAAVEVEKPPPRPPAVIKMDETTKAANKRWRSRVALITKALAAWVPSPDMPLSAIRSSVVVSDDRQEETQTQTQMQSQTLSQMELQVQIEMQTQIQTQGPTTQSVHPFTHTGGGSSPMDKQQLSLTGSSSAVTQPDKLKGQHLTSLENPVQPAKQLNGTLAALHRQPFPRHSQYPPSLGPPPFVPPSSQFYTQSESAASPDLLLDADQQSAINAALNGESFFLTGSAGTGKSFVLKRVIIELRKLGKSVTVTASTGCAAVAIQGCTIHSASGVGMGMEPIDVLRKKARSRKVVRDKLLKPDVLVIDEVSMLDSVLFEKIEAMYTEARFQAGRIPPTGGKRRRWENDREKRRENREREKGKRRRIEIDENGGKGGAKESEKQKRRRVAREFRLGRESGDPEGEAEALLKKVETDKAKFGSLDFKKIANKLEDEKIKNINSAESDEVDVSDNSDDDSDIEDEDNIDDGKLPPFGGLQVIACGDFFQLPPIAAADPVLQHSKQKYFAFSSEAWKRRLRRTVLLRQVHRQSDRNFVGLLNELRYGVVTHRTMRVFSACRVAGNDMEAHDDGSPVHYTKLYAFRGQVYGENKRRLESLGGLAIGYVAKDEIERDKLYGLHESAVRTLLKSGQALDRIVLKRGARVLCVKNVDQEAGIVNGSAGTVVGFTLPKEDLARKRLEMRKTMTIGELREKMLGTFTTDGLIQDEVVDVGHPKIRNYLQWGRCRRGNDGVPEVDVIDGEVLPVVRFDNGVTRTMACEAWSVFGLTGKEVASRRQIPLALGWALTIHKAQGMTLDRVETDVGKAFDYGQVYVAVSRARRMQGLRLTTFMAKKVMAHAEVREFYESTVKKSDRDERREKKRAERNEEKIRQKKRERLMEQIVTSSPDGKKKSEEPILINE